MISLIDQDLFDDFHYLCLIDLSHNHHPNLNPNLHYVFIEKNYENLYTKIKNNRLFKKTVCMYSFLLSLFLVTPIDYYYGNCKDKLDYLKRNIHFDLFYQFQIDNFVLDCLNFLNPNYYSFYNNLNPNDFKSC